jgi:hypothetical protein
VETGVSYLDRFTALWKMGEGWVILHALFERH